MRRIGPYEVVREVGRGAMGVVYAAHDPALERFVALKLILDPDLAGPEEVARLRQEARAAARLRHPNVVSVQAQGVHDGRPYVVMDLVEGESLAARLARSGPPSPREAARLVARLARGLEHAHAAGVVHRDVKPANVIVDARGEPVLVDFGLARLLDRNTRLTGTGVVLGTPAYMAPEQAEGEPGRSGAAADVYALGATLYHLLTGRPPFEAASQLALLESVLTRTPARPSASRPEVDPALEELCLRCLAKEPGERESAGQVAARLEAWLGGEPGAQAGARRARSEPAALVAAGALVLAGFLAWRGVEEGRRADAARAEVTEQAARAAQAVQVADALRGEQAEQLEATRAALHEGRAALAATSDRLEELKGELERQVSRARRQELSARARLAVVVGSNDAAALLEQALREDPGDHELRGLRAYVVAAHMNDASAVEDVERVLSSELDGVGRVAALVARGALRRAAGDLTGAAADADQANRAGAELRGPLVSQLLSHARALSGEARLVRGDSDGAQRASEEALRLDRRNVAAVELRARCLQRVGRGAEAVEMAIHLTVLAPTNVASWLVLATVAQAPDPARARAAAERALLLAPGRAEPWVARGRLRLAAGDPGGALDDLTRAVDLEPRSVDARLLRVEAAASAGRWELVLEDGEQARSALPADHPARPRLEARLTEARQRLGSGHER